MACLSLPKRCDPKNRVRIDPDTGRFTSKKSIYSDPDALADLIYEVTEPTSDQIVYGYGACGVNNSSSPEDILIAFQNVQDLYHISQKGGKRAYQEVLKFENEEISKHNLTPGDLWYIGLSCCKVYFTTYEFQAMFAVHYDKTDFFHIEFIVNSISYVDGRKWFSTDIDMKIRSEHFNMIINEYLYLRNNGQIHMYW